MKKFIDAKGKNCPIPVIMAKKEIESGVNFFEIEVDKAAHIVGKKYDLKHTPTTSIPCSFINLAANILSNPPETIANAFVILSS